MGVCGCAGVQFIAGSCSGRRTKDLNLGACSHVPKNFAAWSSNSFLLERSIELCSKTGKFGDGQTIPLTLTHFYSILPLLISLSLSSSVDFCCSKIGLKYLISVFLTNLTGMSYFWPPFWGNKKSFSHSSSPPAADSESCPTSLGQEGFHFLVLPNYSSVLLKFLSTWILIAVSACLPLLPDSMHRVPNPSVNLLIQISAILLIASLLSPLLASSSFRIFFNYYLYVAALCTPYNRCLVSDSCLSLNT